MEIIQLEQDKEKMDVTFILKGTTPVIANTLRRIMVEEVPVMSIEDVEIVKNNSILYDEIIAHRLGLLPISTDLKSYMLRSECKCEGKGCARCQIQMTLVGKDGTLYASDIKSKDPKIVPVYGKMPIMKLLKGQDFEAVLTAELGKGKDHSKWAPCHVWYKYKPEIEIDQSKVVDAESLVKSCPKGIFDLKSGKVEVNKNKLLECDLCEACIEEGAGSIKLNEKDDEFVFYMESFGQLKVKEILIKAVEMLENQLDIFEEAFGNMESK